LLYLVAIEKEMEEYGVMCIDIVCIAQKNPLDIKQEVCYATIAEIERRCKTFLFLCLAGTYSIKT